MSDSESEEEEQGPKSLSTKRVNVIKRQYYNNNKSNVQRNRIIKTLIDISNGDIEARKPSLKTLVKYGLYNETTLTIELPLKYKSPEINYVYDKPIEELRQTIQVQPKSFGKVSSYNPSNTIISGKLITDWVLNVYSKELVKGKTRSISRLNALARIPKELFKLRKETYDEKKQILSYFLEADLNIQKNKEATFWGVESKKQFIARIQQVIENYPPLTQNVPKAILDIYDNDYKDISNDVVLYTQNKSKRPHFTFSVLKDEVARIFKKVSFQYLVMIMYNKIIGRDNLQAEMRDWHDTTPLNPDVNYLSLDRIEKRSKFILQSYKTSNQYGTDVIDLGTTITNLIIKLHPDNSSKLLFPISIAGTLKKQKLGAFIKSFLKNIPLFSNEEIDLNYLRHSVISSAALDINHRYSGEKRNEELKRIAQLAKHSITQQQTKYIYPLKDEEGKDVNIPKNLNKEWDTITSIIDEGDSNKVEVGDEGESTTKPSYKDKGKAKMISPQNVASKKKDETKPTYMDKGKAKMKGSPIVEDEGESSSAPQMRRSERDKKPVLRFV